MRKYWQEVYGVFLESDDGEGDVDLALRFVIKIAVEVDVVQ